MKYIKSIYILLIYLFVFVSCNKIPEKGEVEFKIQNLKELGTSEYTLKKTIISEDEQWFTIGDRQVIISMKATLKAGLDFSKVKVINIDDKKKSVSIKLPKAEIIVLDIKPKDIEYEFINVSLTRFDFSNEELNKIQILGENQIRKKIKELNILQDASDNAKLFLSNWLKALGFESIKFV